MQLTTLTLEKNSKRKNKVNRIGIIDLGTNSLRFDVYEFKGKKVVRTHREKRMVRLGDGVFETGLIPAEGLQRCLLAFARIRQILNDLKVRHVVAFGTSALRSARNSKEFVEAIKQKTGIQIRVISGTEEGSLIAAGILANVDLPKGPNVMIDIGGGSTEVIVALNKKVVEQHSFNLGANRLKQMFFETLPPTMKKGNMHPELAMRQYIREKTFNLVAGRNWSTVKFAVGSSGTIRTLSRVLKKIGRGSQSIERYELSSLVAEMKVMTRSQLLSLPGLEPKRVDLILAGAILLEELMYALRLRKIAVTDYALRDGILVEAFKKIQKGAKK